MHFHFHGLVGASTPGHASDSADARRARGSPAGVGGAAAMRRCAAVIAGVIAGVALAGCASFSPDGGFGAVQQLASERLVNTPSQQRTAEQSTAARARVAELLRQPLSPDTAVEVALLNHRGLQARYAELGVAESELVRAGRLGNPSLRLGRVSGGGVEIDRGVMFDVLGLLTMPVARGVAQLRLEQAQLQAAHDTVGVAAEARITFFEAVAAQQLVGYFGQVKEAAEASSELARRMAEAGNFSRLAQMREQSFQLDATTQLARAQHHAVATRERLVRALSLSGEQLDFRLPERLPDLPSSPAEPLDAEQTAMDRRLDVLKARRATEATARSLELTQATRFVNVLHAGYQNQSATGEPRRQGFEVELELPLFDFGSTRVARAEAIYLQAVNEAAAVAVQARSEVRESCSAYRTAYELARHYRDEVVPLRKRISEENLLRYNGMLASVFDLLADARGQIAGVVGAVNALRDHWIAETRLQTALTSGSPTGAGPVTAAQAATPGTAAGH